MAKERNKKHRIAVKHKSADKYVGRPKQHNTIESKSTPNLLQVTPLQ